MSVRTRLRCCVRHRRLPKRAGLNQPEQRRHPPWEYPDSVDAWLRAVADMHRTSQSSLTRSAHSRGIRNGDWYSVQRPISLGSELLLSNGTSWSLGSRSGQMELGTWASSERAMISATCLFHPHRGAVADAIRRPWGLPVARDRRRPARQISLPPPAGWGARAVERRHTGRALVRSARSEKPTRRRIRSPIASAGRSCRDHRPVRQARSPRNYRRLCGKTMRTRLPVSPIEAGDAESNPPCRATVALYEHREARGPSGRGAGAASADFARARGADAVVFTPERARNDNDGS